MTVSIEKTERAAVLLLGGSGERFNSDKPKQFTLIGGKLLFLYPLEKLEKNEKVEGIVLVAPKDYLAFVAKTVQELGFRKVLAVIEGGATRQDSSRRATDYLRDKGLPFPSLILIHDAARPNINDRLIEEGYAKAILDGASVTALASSDSVAISKDGATISEYQDRSKVYNLQTPQTFALSLLYAAHEKAFAAHHLYTDDGSLVLAETGVAPAIVEGDKKNIKITTVEDLGVFRKEQP
jgi:2-C-methyl-D-erythritol 4-phosphate cytidylyltransferase